jgi:hydrogenase maturation protein HypF
LVVRGVVQGVGFRPWVFHLATELGLTGGVSNTTQGVVIELEGDRGKVEVFLTRVIAEQPPHSSIQSLEATWLDAAGYTEFSIWPSDPQGDKTALVMPDVATCPECVREIFDPGNRRFGYPFTNCTHCGPRYSIITNLPYDRPNTTMARFAMCPACQAEYENVRDRRFHAQPNACPACGPRVELWDQQGRARHSGQAAWHEAVGCLRAGKVLAVKGLGGFHLLVAACDEAAVEGLRARKRREEKPLAVMFPSLAAIARFCECSGLERRALCSPAAPIVLLRRRRAAGCGASPDLAAAVAPGNPNVGALLPYTPLHHLLLAALGEPVVATSGNLAEEPICTDEHEAVDRLGAIADLFLVHNRPIARHVDDSVVRVAAGRELVLRRARGYAPLPITVREDLPPTLGVGAQLKNSVALGRGHYVFVSQHIGDLESAPAQAAFARVTDDLPRLFGVRPEVYAADLHPDYVSTQSARRSGRPVVCVQHHYAHVLSCMAENDAAAPLLGVSWDGTGLGEDQTVWGGEFIRVSTRSFERAACLRAFCLPGGERAVREPRRAALGLLYALYADAAFELRDLPTLRAFRPAELDTLRQMLHAHLNSPVTSSAGRLFDAVASLLGLRQRTGFEGQAAMDLEFAVDDDDTDQAYPMPLNEVSRSLSHNGQPRGTRASHRECEAYRRARPRFVLDWGPAIAGLLGDARAGIPVWNLATRFHNTLADGILAVARRVGERRVVLTGGCFQNKCLLERATQRLRSEGFSPYWHQRIPPNDGGIALGQVIAAARAHPEKGARRCA